MKKYGKIPPHFLYYLENEGIQVSDMKSSVFALKENYDRMQVKFPYSNRTLDIQIIFDLMNSSNPPDFILVKDENIVLNYQEITKDWKFKESSTLYVSLSKIKHFFALNQAKRLKEEIENNKNNENFPHSNDFNNDIIELWQTIEKIYSFIKNKLLNYKNIENYLNNFDKKDTDLSFTGSNNSQSGLKKLRLQNLSININSNINTNLNSSDLNNNIGDEFYNINEISKNEMKNRTLNNKSVSSLNYKAINNSEEVNSQISHSGNTGNREILPEIWFSYLSNNNSSYVSNIDYTDYKNFITLSYPLDIEIRSRNIPRYPYINLTIFLNYDMKFKLDFQASFLVNTNNIKFRNEMIFDIKNFESAIENFESSVYEYFSDMNMRENIINRIINLNIGYTLEVDSSGFRKLSQYIHVNDQSNLIRKNDFDPKKTKNISKGSNNSPGNSPNVKINSFYFNFVVCYNFDKDDAKVLNVNIIDSDQLSNFAQKKISFGNSKEKDVDNLINHIFEFLINNIQKKLNYF